MLAVVASGRRAELLELAYAYVRTHGLSDLSLRPLAAEIGSSPRVLLFLFESKEGLVRALLTRAREDELTLLSTLPPAAGLTTAAKTVWQWLSAETNRPVLRLWLEAYARSLVDESGPWSGFAAATVADWLAVLAASEPPSPDAEIRRTAALAILRGALLDLLATGDEPRITAAVHRQLQSL